MINCDEDALQCDLAETYHIFNIRELPLTTVALFSVGLRDNSRIKKKMAGVSYDFKEVAMMRIIDQLAMLFWQNTKDATKGKNMPKSLIEKLLNINQEKQTTSFNTIEEFEKARNEILKERGE